MDRLMIEDHLIKYVYKYNDNDLIEIVELYNRVGNVYYC